MIILFFCTNNSPRQFPKRIWFVWAQGRRSSLLPPTGHELQHTLGDCKTWILTWVLDLRCAENELRRSWGLLLRSSSRCSRWSIAGTTKRCWAQTLQSGESQTSAIKIYICNIKAYKKIVNDHFHFFFQALPGKKYQLAFDHFGLCLQ